MASLVRVDPCLQLRAVHLAPRAHIALMSSQTRPAVCASALFPVADLAKPLHNDIGDLKIVLIKHHHVRITFNAVVWK